MITLNAGLGTICWSLQASDIVLPASTAHIHRGAAGIAGPIALFLTPPGEDGSVSGCDTNVPRELIVEILSNTSAFYVNVHTSEFPLGAIRAQLR